ncbi:MAG: BlaI/MecI/CopY family transcriptional regulator [Lachnospiraceae bacterium]|nr:BlaI/MecI/CopY family transcriptional regulator [Lachnospiraceae bacterium]
MKRRELLNGREEELMFILWERQEPTSSVGIMDDLLKEGWNRVTVYSTIQSLIDKGFLTVIGMQKSNTQYARQFEPSITKEEYAARLLIEKGLGCETLGNIALAMAGSASSGKKDNKDRKENEKLIKELEDTIRKLKEGE